jgi:glycosyltransferase involved in cell wall biosynthesis
LTESAMTQRRGVLSQEVGPARAADLFLAGRTEEALTALAPDDAGHAALSWKRRLLANLGRLEEAAAAGAAVLSHPDAGADDHLHLGEIYARLGRWTEAAKQAAAAAVDPVDPRPLCLTIAAALADPALRPAAAPLSPSLSPLTLSQAPPRVALPGGLAAPAFSDAKHPMVHATLMAADGVEFTRARPISGPAAAVMLGKFDLCRAAYEGLLTAVPGVAADVAARYVGHRALSLLNQVDGPALDLLTVTPMTVGQRPYLLLFDVLAGLFQPFLPFNRMTVPDRSCSWLRIIRAWLESPHCVGIYAPYAGATDLLGGFFDSPEIARKSMMVDHLPSDAARRAAAGAPPPPQPVSSDRPARLLFTASALEPADKFLFRGGVYALCAFRTLAARFPGLRLVMRTPLPTALDPVLRDFALNHPDVQVIQQPLDDADYFRLFADADVFLSPSAALYMNSVLNAMRFGAVPVVSDVFGADELIRPNRNGVLVRLERGARIDLSRGAVEQDFSSFQRLDGPGDPVFFHNYCDALADLLADPQRLAALSRQAMADMESDLPYRRRGLPMSEILHRAQRQATAVLQQRPPLFMPERRSYTNPPND